MPVAQLNHVTVRTDDLEGTRDFYHDMLGLKAGPRPLGFPGYWLYAGENPLVHLVPKSHGIGGGASQNTGNFDHVAFSAADFSGMPQAVAHAAGEGSERVLLPEPAGAALLVARFALRAFERARHQVS